MARRAPTSEEFSPVQAAGARAQRALEALHRPIPPVGEGIPPAQEKVSVAPPPLARQQRAFDEQPEPQPADAEPKVSRRVVMSKSDEDEVLRVVREIEAASRCKVNFSHVTRALLAALRHAEAEVVHEFSRLAGTMSRPPMYDTVATVRFERQIAEAVAAGLRKMDPMR